MDTNHVRIFVPLGKRGTHLPSVTVIMRSVRDPRLSQAHRFILAIIGQAPLSWMPRPAIEGRITALRVPVSPVEFVRQVLSDLVELEYVLVEERDGVPHYFVFQPLEGLHHAA